MANTEDKLSVLDSDIVILDSYLNAVISGVKSPAQAVAKEYDVKPSLVYSKINRNKGYLKEKVDAYFKEASVDKLQVLQEVKSIAYFNIVDIAYFDGNDISYEDWKKLPREITACIKNVTVTENTKTGIKTVHLEFYDKQKAIDQLIKMLEIGADKVKHEHSGEITHKTRLFDGVMEDMKSINEDYQSGSETPPANDDLPVIEAGVATSVQAENSR